MKVKSILLRPITLIEVLTNVDSDGQEYMKPKSKVPCRRGYG